MKIKLLTMVALLASLLLLLGGTALAAPAINRWGPIVRFEGRVAQMTNSYWIVDGRRVEMTGQTIMEGEIMLGLRVEVTARVRDSETLVALRIRLQNQAQQPDETPGGPNQTPCATCTPNHYQTPGPHQTPDETPGGPNQTPCATQTPNNYDYQTPGPHQTPTPRGRQG